MNRSPGEYFRGLPQEFAEHRFNSSIVRGKTSVNLITASIWLARNQRLALPSDLDINEVSFHPEIFANDNKKIATPLLVFMRAGYDLAAGLINDSIPTYELPPSLKDRNYKEKTISALADILSFLTAMDDEDEVNWSTPVRSPRSYREVYFSSSPTKLNPGIDISFYVRTNRLQMTLHSSTDSEDLQVKVISNLKGNPITNVQNWELLFYANARSYGSGTTENISGLLFGDQQAILLATGTHAETQRIQFKLMRDLHIPQLLPVSARMAISEASPQTHLTT